MPRGGSAASSLEVFERVADQPAGGPAAVFRRGADIRNGLDSGLRQFFGFGNEGGGQLFAGQELFHLCQAALPSMTLTLSPLASAGTIRVAKTAGAIAVLWVAVAWALGWLGT